MMYSFDLDPHTGILRAKMRGHWTLAVAERFSDELEERMTEARRIAGHLKLLLDASEHGAQMAEVIHFLIQRRQSYTRQPSDRLAVCTTSPFSRSQAQRRSQDSGTSIFSSVAGARGWLLDRSESKSSAA